MIYIDSASTDACENFALEDFVIEREGWHAPVLLFWRTRPTLMLGNFQNVYAEIDLPYAREKGLAVVRRRSGGGTIFTDPGSWQYSCFFPHAKGEDADFRQAASGVCDALRALGVPAEFNGRNDLVVGGRKISGNARHVHPQGVLHHGSLLFDTDFETMQRALTPPADKIAGKGVASVRGRVANISEFLTQPMTALEFKKKMLDHLLSPSDEIYELSREESIEIAARADRYRSWEWNFANGPKFEISRKRRFAGGQVECALNVREGRIAEVRLYGDFFASGDLAPLYAALVGTRYERESLRAALSEFCVSALIAGVDNQNLLDALID